MRKTLWRQWEPSIHPTVGRPWFKVLTKVMHSVTQCLGYGGVEMVCPNIVKSTREGHFRELLLRIWRGFAGADTIHDIFHRRVNNERLIFVRFPRAERRAAQQRTQGKQGSVTHDGLRLSWQRNPGEFA